MRFHTVAAVALAVALALPWAVSAHAAPPPPPAPPPLSAEAIDTADFQGWRTRVDDGAKARDDAAKQASDEAARKRKGRKRAASAKTPAPAAARDQPPDPFLIRVQILLDRAHASPGAIDGLDGDNLKKAVRAFREMRGMPLDGGLDEPLWTALSADGGRATKSYSTYNEDINGRYVEKLPADYARLAKLKWLGFRDPVEMLAERFHLDEKLLRTLNPTARFKSAGETILVADTGPAAQGKVERIVVDKKAGEMRGYDGGGRILIVAPATIGSPDTPSPDGKMTVNGAFPDPHYIYDPKKNFQQGKNRSKLDLPPGPNGPVGAMWIDLSKPTYGIHGTPEPSQISKTASHGCVRLTNWDAAELAGMIVPKKTSVEFE